MSRNYLIFNGKDFRDFDCYLYPDVIFNQPEKDVEVIEVAGRNGNVLIDHNRYMDIQHGYNCLIIRNFKENFAALRNFLTAQTGYFRLEDTFNPDEFYLAYHNGGLTVEDADARMGKFSLSFTRKPQRFLKVGEDEKTYTETATIYNPSSMIARPLIRVYGNGELTVNDKTITIANNATYIDIDSEDMSCHTGTTDASSKVSLEDYQFPVFDRFENVIDIPSGSSITIFTVIPRWWIL